MEEDAFYDWRLVKKVSLVVTLLPFSTHSYQVRRSLKILRENKDARGCLGVLETCIRSNFAGVESPRLYSEVDLLIILSLEPLLMNQKDLSWYKGPYRMQEPPTLIIIAQY